MSTFDTSLREDLKTIIRDRNEDGMKLLAERFQDVDGVSKSLKVDFNFGISENEEEMTLRRKIFGANFVEGKKPRTYLQFWIDAFSDFTILMLTGSACISLLIAFFIEKTLVSFAEGLAILVSILFVTNLAAMNDFRKQTQFNRLNAIAKNVDVNVLRNGQKKVISSTEVLVGDIVFVAVGDILCADGLLVDGSNLSADESSLTGEPKLITKDVKMAPVMLSGTSVMEGQGRFLVTAVGVHSESGQIREMILRGAHPTGDSREHDSADGKAPAPSDAIEVETSPLTAKLDALAILMGKFATIVAILSFVFLVLRFSLEAYLINNANFKCLTIFESTCDSSDVTRFGIFPSCAVPGHSTPCCSQVGSDVEILGAPCGWLSPHLSVYTHFLIVAITLLVMAVPEGLPLAVTLSLAFSVIRMQDDHNLVKHLDSCETMGSATTICSDKTGTLTKNRMTVMKAYFCGKNFAHNSQQGCGKDASGKLSAEVKKVIADGVSLNSTADILWNPDIRLYEQLGNKTECALLQFVAEMDINYKAVRSSDEFKVIDPKTGRGVNTIKVNPFSSARKRASVVVKSPVPGKMRVYAKGASEILLGLCTSKLNNDLTVTSLSQEEKDLVNTNVIKVFADNAMRTICLAYRDLENNFDLDSTDPLDPETLLTETDLTFVGIVGIEDPLRDEVIEAIKKCRTAGVDVRMVTGDNLNTAVAIAKGCGILREGTDLDADGNPIPFAAMTGPAFRKHVLKDGNKIDQEAFDEIWPFLRVLARSSPADKFTLVTGLKESELYATARGMELGIYHDQQVIAVTGDGTNDAPALKKADVGFAMGITGTSVAKDAADIILLDDNFSSIVAACKWGRNVYDSISKFLQFQVSVNIIAIIVSLVGILSFSAVPLSAVQMLWTNVIMDSLASLSLATDDPTDDLLKRSPYGRKKSMLSKKIKWNIAGQVVLQCTVLIVIMFVGDSFFNVANGVSYSILGVPSVHFTLVFNTFIWFQLFNQINARKVHHERNVFQGIVVNKYFFTIWSFEAIAQILLVQFGGIFFNTSPLTAEQWAFCVLIGLITLPYQQVIITIADFVEYRRSTCKEKYSASGKLPVSESVSLPIATVAKSASETESKANVFLVHALSSSDAHDLVERAKLKELRRVHSASMATPAPSFFSVHNRRRLLTDRETLMELTSGKRFAEMTEMQNRAIEYRKSLSKEK